MDGLRLRVDLKLSDKYLPLLFRNSVMSALKSLLGEEYFTERSPRPFSFFLSFQGELDTNRFLLKEPYARLYMSFLDKKLGEETAGKLISLRDFPIDKNLKISVNSIKSLRVKKIDQRAVFKVLSPAIIEDKEDKPILPWDRNFEREFNLLHRKVFDLLGYSYEDVSLRYLFWKKVVIKHTLRGFRRASGKRVMYLTGFVGRFELKGNPESLKLLYLKGWGVRTGEGFGFVDVL